MSSAVAYGYRMNERGRVVHRMFDINELRHGEASRNGWVDAPDKVKGFALAEVNKASFKAAHAGTTGKEPKPIGQVYGSEDSKDIRPPVTRRKLASNSPVIQKPKVSAEKQPAGNSAGNSPAVLRNAAGRAVDARGRYVKA